MVACNKITGFQFEITALIYSNISIVFSLADTYLGNSIVYIVLSKHVRD